MGSDQIGEAEAILAAMRRGVSNADANTKAYGDRCPDGRLANPQTSSCQGRQDNWDGLGDNDRAQKPEQAWYPDLTLTQRELQEKGMIKTSPFLHRIGVKNGFTGKVEDAAGRTQCYQQGSHVACGQLPEGGGQKQSATSEGMASDEELVEMARQIKEAEAVRNKINYRKDKEGYKKADEAVQQIVSKFRKAGSVERRMAAFAALKGPPSAESEKPSTPEPAPSEASQPEPKQPAPEPPPSHGEKDDGPFPIAVYGEPLARSAVNDYADRADETLRDKLINIDKFKKERSYGLTDDGTQWNAVGTEHSVTSESGQLRKIVGGIFTHTHPSHSSFSKADVLVAQKYRLKEMRAVTRDGTFILGPPKGGWGSIDVDLAKEYGPITGYANANIVQLAKKYGLYYEFIPLKKPEKSLGSEFGQKSIKPPTVGPSPFLRRCPDGSTMPPSVRTCSGREGWTPWTEEQRRQESLSEPPKGPPPDSGPIAGRYPNDVEAKAVDPAAAGRLDRARRADLIELPPDVQGTLCSGCQYLDRTRENFCAHPKMMLALEDGKDAMTCRYYDNPKVQHPPGLRRTELVVLSDDLLERARAADLITLPPELWGKGTSCPTCRFQRDGFCRNPKVDQEVTPRECCDFWDSTRAKRAWEGKKSLDVSVKSEERTDKAGRHYCVEKGQGIVACGDGAKGEQATPSSKKKLHDAAYIGEKIREALVERPSRGQHGDTGNNSFFIYEDGRILSWDHPDRKARNIISHMVHSHSGDLRKPGEPDLDFMPHNADDVSILLEGLKKGDKTASTVIMDDGRMETLRISPDATPEQKKALAKLSKKQLVKDINVTYEQARKAWKERGIQAHEFMRENLAAFAYHYGLEYTLGDWKTGESKRVPPPSWYWKMVGKEEPKPGEAAKALSYEGKSGFTGKKEDSAGRTQCYQQGEHVACGQAQEQAGGDAQPASSSVSQLREQAREAYKADNLEEMRKVADALGVEIPPDYNAIDAYSRVHKRLQQREYEEASEEAIRSGQATRYPPHQVTNLEGLELTVTTWPEDWGIKPGTYTMYRGGKATSPRGVFFAPDLGSAQMYGDLHGLKAEKYEVTISNPKIFDNYIDGLMAATGKTRQQVISSRDRAANVNTWWQAADKKIVDWAKKQGYDAVTFVRPALPALREVTYIGDPSNIKKAGEAETKALSDPAGDFVERDQDLFSRPQGMPPLKNGHADQDAYRSIEGSDLNPYANEKSWLGGAVPRAKVLPPGWLAKHGFTGRRKDKIGRTHCYADGQHVACGQTGAASQEEHKNPINQESFKEGDAGTTEQVRELAARRLADHWQVSDEDLQAMGKENKTPWKNKYEAAESILKDWSGSAGGPIATAAATAVADDLGLPYTFHTESQRHVNDYIRERPALQRFAASFGRAMYEATQEWLKQHGIEKLTLIRAGGESSTQPASSWSLSWGGARHDPNRETVRSTIPAKYILSVPATGFGTLAESEVVVLPRQETLDVDVRGKEKGEWKRIKSAPEARSALARLGSLGVKAAKLLWDSPDMVEHAVTSWAKTNFARKQPKEGPPSKLERVAAGVWWATKKTLTVAYGSWLALESAAEHVALARGASPEQASLLKHALLMNDAKLFKLGGLLMHFVPGAQALEVPFAFVPVASCAYLAYSLVRDWRKRQEILRGAMQGVRSAWDEARGKKDLPLDDVGAERMVELMNAHGDDRTFAYLMAAYDFTRDLGRAVELAAQALEAASPAGRTGQKGGFTGRKEDSVGRTQCYQQGAHVACNLQKKEGEQQAKKKVEFPETITIEGKVYTATGKTGKHYATGNESREYESDDYDTHWIHAGQLQGDHIASTFDDTLPEGLSATTRDRMLRAGQLTYTEEKAAAGDIKTWADDWYMEGIHPSDATIKNLASTRPGKPIRVYRGHIKGEGHSSIEAWTTDKTYAEMYADLEDRELISRVVHPSEIVADMSKIRAHDPEVVIANGEYAKRVAGLRGEKLTSTSGTEKVEKRSKGSASDGSSGGVKMMRRPAFFVKAGFTGTKKDRAGRRQCYQQGAHVACGQQQAPTTQRPLASTPTAAVHKPKASRSEMVAVRRVGKGKDARLLLADGRPAPEHIKPSMVPPNWTDVQIAVDPDADLLVSARDQAGRLKSVYSDSYAMKTAAIKFARIHEGLQKKQMMHDQNQANRSNPELRDAADCLWLIEEQGTRPGSDKDTKSKVKAYGATTLLGQHVEVQGNEVRLHFIGKEGIEHNHVIRNPELAAMLKERAAKAGPDGRLFQVTDDQLRDYTRTLDSGSFTPKDFRTMLASSMAAKLVSERAVPANAKEYKKAVKEVAEQVSHVLGNRPQQAIESYITPTIWTVWRRHAVPA